jgi:hypothetical protein
MQKVVVVSTNKFTGNTGEGQVASLRIARTQNQAGLAANDTQCMSGGKGWPF